MIWHAFPALDLSVLYRSRTASHPNGRLGSRYSRAVLYRNVPGIRLRGKLLGMGCDERYTAVLRGLYRSLLVEAVDHVANATGCQGDWLTQNIQVPSTAAYQV